MREMARGNGAGRMEQPWAPTTCGVSPLFAQHRLDGILTAIEFLRCKICGLPDL